MTARTKRTYNLSERTVRRVRELASEYGTSSSQDGVVELAVDRLYRDVLDEAEARRWAEAAEDPEFRAEVERIGRTFDDRESWPA